MADSTLKPVIVVVSPAKEYTEIQRQANARKENNKEVEKKSSGWLKAIAVVAAPVAPFVSVGLAAADAVISKSHGEHSVKTKLDFKSVDAIPVDEIAARLSSNNVKVYDTRYYQEGDVYIRHPYLKDTYIQATREQVEVFGDVFDAMSNIVQYLGVTKMSAKIQLGNEFKREFGVNGKVEISECPIKFGVEYDTKQGELNRSAARFCKEFVNPKVDFCAALHAAQNNGLIDIPKVKNLIDQRNPISTGSVLKRDSVELMISKRMNDSFNIAFSLTEPNSGITVGAGYKNALEKGYTMKYELIIEF